MDIKLTKNNSRTEIIFEQEKDDEYFYQIIFRSVKTKKITKSMMVTKRDIDDYLSGYKNDGWIVNE